MTNRRKFLAQSTIAATAILAAKPFQTFAKAGGSFAISNRVILFHSGALQTAGGFSLLREAISDTKLELDHLVLLDTGSNTVTVKDRADQLMEQISRLKYDAALPGEIYLAEENNSSRVPMVISNHPAGHSYQVVKKGKYKIGVIGAGKYNNPVQELTELATKLKGEGCHLVVCLSALGSNKNEINDRVLAKGSKNIDVIIGTTGLATMNPEVIINADKHQVLINHTSSEGVMIGKIEIGFDDEGSKRSMTFSNLHRHNDSTKWTRCKLA